MGGKGSGGARTRSGPAPSDESLRQGRAVGEWYFLPATGRDGATPTWPFASEPANDHEQDLWVALWTRPQAVRWEVYEQHREVAQYVRVSIAAETPAGAAKLAPLVQRLADSLGLTTAGLRANRWKITPVRPVEDDQDEPDDTPPPSTPPPSGSQRTSARDRFRSVS